MSEPEWARDIRAGILIFVNQVLPFLEKEEIFCADMELGNAIFILKEGHGKAPEGTAKMHTRGLLAGLKLLKGHCKAGWEKNKYDPVDLQRTVGKYVDDKMRLVALCINPFLEDKLEDKIDPHPALDKYLAKKFKKPYVEPKAYHYLHESASGTSLIRRINKANVLVKLPDEERDYYLPIDHRDKRILVIFDGELLYGGLPKAAKVILREPKGYISAPASQFQAGVGYQCIAMPDYSLNGLMAEVSIWRYFILIPSRTAVVRKYRAKNLSPVYVVITVRKDGDRVIWQTTSP